jgi:hypothetical protein
LIGHEPITHLRLFSRLDFLLSRNNGEGWATCLTFVDEARVVHNVAHRALFAIYMVYFLIAFLDVLPAGHHFLL